MSKKSAKNPPLTQAATDSALASCTLSEAHEHDTEHLPLIDPLDGTRIHLADSRRERNYDYDAVVLGAGPAGEAAAMKLAKSGKKVAVIDPRGQVGGNCAHVGTIPSKALRQSVFNIINFRRDPLFSQIIDNHQVPLNKVLSKARDVIRSQVNTHALFYERNQVDVLLSLIHI